MSDLTATLRILNPVPGVFAYYDGRIAGRRLHAEGPNWLDDGAYGLGTASYAIVEAGDGLVYDTHMSMTHAQAIRSHLAGLGIARPRVVLSHWHKDHVAGNEAFVDCEIIALRLTADLLAKNRAEIETGDPPISPLVMPNRLFESRLDLSVGGRRIECHHFDIHSADGVILWLPDEGILFAGDTLEDTVTYIVEPDQLATHIRELTRLRTWPIRHILPNHGDPDRIEAGGYRPDLIDATLAYLERLTDPADLALRDTLSLRDYLAPHGVIYFDAYEAVHRRNVALVKALAPKGSAAEDAPSRP